MIINGSSRSNGLQLGGYLLDLFGRDKNENIEVLEVAHPEPYLVEALKQMQEITGSGQRGQKGLYHAQISPAIGEDLELSPAQWIRAADVLEEQMGLEGQARALVTHEKNGRIHLHAVWQRYDLDQGKLLSDSWDYIKHEKASRQLEEEFGHEPVSSPHLDKEKRSENSYEHGDKMQGERSKIDRATLKQELTAAYQESDNGKAFTQALSERGFILAQGRHKSFSIVDENSTVYNPVRFIEDVKTKEFKAKFADIKRDNLPSVEEAKAIQREQNNTPTISQEGDRLARIQAGERIQLLKSQQKAQKHLKRSHLKEIEAFDKAKTQEITLAANKDKAGVVKSLFLKITRRYKAHEKKCKDQHQERIKMAALERVNLIKNQKEIRLKSQSTDKDKRKWLLFQQAKIRKQFNECEQKIIKSRIPEYQRKFTKSKNLKPIYKPDIKPDISKNEETIEDTKFDSKGDIDLDKLGNEKVVSKDKDYSKFDDKGDIDLDKLGQNEREKERKKKDRPHEYERPDDENEH